MGGGYQINPSGAVNGPATVAASRASIGAFDRQEPPVSPDAPRTRHLDAEGRPRYTNALVDEASPYLRQHAHNPVDWRPWGEAAFAEARRRGVPVFLSVGYSTCHWCHVMEHESFEDEEVAAYLNARYVPVKVDREERPDVDAVYMAFLQLTTGGGGWPMSVWLTPEKRPLFAGTYFPARDGDRGSHRGFLSLLQIIADRWHTPAFQAQADPALARLVKPDAPSSDVPSTAVLARGAQVFERIADQRWGGFGDAPKFPRPCVLAFLLRQSRREGDPETVEQVRLTLERMFCGGMYDHVGGGFARYSVDRFWRVPHFEKMLYDNAQLVVAYLEGYQVTGEPLFAAVAEDVLAYLDREMSDPLGGFYSATDADSADPAGEMHEGYFFVWTPEALSALVDAGELSAEDAGWIAETFDVRPGGNFEGRSVLHLAQPLGEAAAARWQALRVVLAKARAHRPAPGLDDKVLTAWNGLAIQAFARAAIVLGRPGYAQRAARAATCVLEQLADPERPGRLMRAWRAGQAKHGAVLEDYAAMILGLLDLLEATGEVRWLDAAIALQGVLDRAFAAPAGGYFRTPHDGEALLFREKPMYDGAEPSGNSQAALGLVRLAEITGDAEYRRRAESTLRAMGRTLSSTPHAAPLALCALDRLRALDAGEASLVVIVTPEGDPAGADGLYREARSVFAPYASRLIGPASGALARRVPAFAQRVAIDGEATAYVCVGTRCDLPTRSPTALAERLGGSGQMGG